MGRWVPENPNWWNSAVIATVSAAFAKTMCQKPRVMRPVPSGSTFWTVGHDGVVRQHVALAAWNGFLSRVFRKLHGRVITGPGISDDGMFRAGPHFDSYLPRWRQP
jgi:hypothetical protein